MSIYSVSLRGRRKDNEDGHNIEPNNNMYSKTHDPNKKNIDYFAIYDGHGGKYVSQFLQENMPMCFMDKRTTYPLHKNYVYSVYNAIQSTLKKYKFSQDMGSTSLICIIFDYNNSKYLNIINLGDCRCVLCRENIALPLTKDHKPHWPEEKHRIEALGGKLTHDGFDWRINGLSVSRSFGDFDAVPHLTHIPDMFRYRLINDDKFIIIACDGLWDVLSNDEAVNFVLLNCYDKTLTKRINKNVNIARKLAEYAIMKKSTDNITVIIKFFD